MLLVLGFILAVLGLALLWIGLRLIIKLDTLSDWIEEWKEEE